MTGVDWKAATGEVAVYVVRYGLTRNSYATNLIADWVRRIWPAVSYPERRVIIRDVRTHLEREARFAAEPVGDADVMVWRSLLLWMEVRA